MKFFLSAQSKMFYAHLIVEAECEDTARAAAKDFLSVMADEDRDDNPEVDSEELNYSEISKLYLLTNSDGYWTNPDIKTVNPTDYACIRFSESILDGEPDDEGHEYKVWLWEACSL